MSVFLYVRVSSKSSADSGISIADQIERGLAYAMENIPNSKIAGTSYGCHTPGVYCDEAVSGWSKPFCTRPAGRMLSMELKEGDHVVFYSVDRAARNVRDFANTVWDLERRGVYVHFISDQINSTTAIGKFQLNMRAAAAQFFSDLISERTREALAIRRMQEGERPFVCKKRTKWVATAPDGIFIPSPQIERPTGRIFRYERVSSDRQYTSGLGLEHQSRSTLIAARRLSLELPGSAIYPEVFSDPAVSAFSKRFNERPAGKALLDTVKPGDDIVIYRLDRAWRNPIDALEMIEELLEKQVYIHLVNEGIRTDTKQGVEWVGVLAAMAHMESTLRSTRVKQALAACKAKGRPWSRQMPLGWKGKEIRPGVKKMVLDLKAMSRKALVWVMRYELNMSNAEIEACLVARKCLKKKKPATLAHIQRWHIPEALDDCKRLRDSVSPKIWEQAMEMARQELDKPIRRKYWYRPEWEGESMSIRRLALCETAQ